MNPYLEPIRQTLPRLLALFDTDKTSDSYGMGDRYHWAWGLIDFGNGTFQGAVHGMARLWHAGLWPYPANRDFFFARIDSMFLGAKRLTRYNGSLEEAFPNEGSFCVTALVAFDLLCAADLLKNQVPPKMFTRWQTIIRPMIEYIMVAEETHAFISNHLATAVAALSRWHLLSGEPQSEERAKTLLKLILANQSEEGWFREYEGADPGYQTLCTYYLADVHIQRPGWGLGPVLAKSVNFLWNFAHPDGSFGGLYGCRNTRFYYPGGLEALGAEFPEAAVFANFMARSISDGRIVTLAAMDEPNLVPMFNAYCWAAALWRPMGDTASLVLPALREVEARVSFPEAGLLIDAGPRHYTIVNTHKGGVLVHFFDRKLATIDAGAVVRRSNGALASTQSYATDNSVDLDNNTLVVKSTFAAMPKSLPSPLQFVVLRILCLTAFRVRILREWSKRLLVRILITRRKLWKAQNLRRIYLGEGLAVNDELLDGHGLTRVDSPGPFVSIHMASQGYWQLQDEDPLA